jgi:polyisoprenoid-binding protein YceI
MSYKSTFPVVSLVLALGGGARANEWQIDPAHTTAEFSVKHMMVSTVRGFFQKVSGTVDLDDKDPTRSKVDVTIDAASVDTREPKRDAHLRSPDFFDVAKFPNITFKSTKVEKAGGQLRVIGDLTMRGQTHPVTLLVEGPTPAMKAPWGAQSRGVSATGKLSRKEWGLNWNKAIEAGGVLVSDEVQLTIDAELIVRPPSPPAAQK